jgi:hypothetical protein
MTTPDKNVLIGLDYELIRGITLALSRVSGLHILKWIGTPSTYLDENLVAQAQMSKADFVISHVENNQDLNSLRRLLELHIHPVILCDMLFALPQRKQSADEVKQLRDEGQVSVFQLRLDYQNRVAQIMQELLTNTKQS